MGEDDGYLSCTEDEMLDALSRALFPERADVYDGDGAYTATEMSKAVGVSVTTATTRAEVAVERGELVEVVKVIRDRAGRTRYSRAWVTTDVYERWKNEQSDQER